MPIKFKINGKENANIDELFKDISQVSEKLNRRIIMAVQAACLKVVERARNLPSPPATMRYKTITTEDGKTKKVYNPHQPNYIDDSEVLRNSIGFAIYDKGVKVAANFESKPGSELGIAVADETAARFPNSFVAIIVAGANYAAAVESKGYFVLTEPASHLGEELMAYLREIKI
ncbi:MAG: hypothetical protein II937_09880 [Bacteroidales bacterium]|nr:hypothetical protein [Bacteroidales bacterium]